MTPAASGDPRIRDLGGRERLQLPFGAHPEAHYGTLIDTTHGGILARLEAARRAIK